MTTKRICILVSGGGTNLQRIIDAVLSGEIPGAEVIKVIADRPCFATTRAENHGIEVAQLKRGKDFQQQLLDAIPPDTDFMVLAGFLSILNEEICTRFKGRIINIHPALLPKFGGAGMWGAHVHKAVIDAGETYSGATVHYVTPGIDEGEIILQEAVAISEGETPASLAQKIHEIEYQIFPKAIKKALAQLQEK